jgi:hypothetical protein
VQAKAQALEHARAADTVERSLANRPSLEEAMRNCDVSSNASHPRLVLNTVQHFPLWLFIPLAGIILYMLLNMD